MDSQRVAIFPDTNVFLHFRPLNEIDWRTLLNAIVVEIKIAPVVTRELEQQKTFNPSRKLRDRADSSLRLLHRYLDENEVRDGATLEFLVSEPNIDMASALSLNLQLGDDRLIGTLLMFQEQHPDIPPVLVTNDLPLTVKAKHHRIHVTPLSSDLRLPSEPDPLEQKNKELEAELLRYKLREPVLDLTFTDGEQHAHFQPPQPTDMSDPEPEIQSLLAAAREKCKPVVHSIPMPPDPDSIVGRALLQMGGESVLRATQLVDSWSTDFDRSYNERVARYHHNYEKYLRDKHAFKTLPI